MEDFKKRLSDKIASTVKSDATERRILSSRVAGMIDMIESALLRNDLALANKLGDLLSTCLEEELPSPPPRESSVGQEVPLELAGVFPGKHLPALQDNINRAAQNADPGRVIEAARQTLPSLLEQIGLGDGFEPSDLYDATKITALFERVLELYREERLSFYTDRAEEMKSMDFAAFFPELLAGSEPTGARGEYYGFSRLLVISLVLLQLFTILTSALDPFTAGAGALTLAAKSLPFIASFAASYLMSIPEPTDHEKDNKEKTDSEHLVNGTLAEGFDMQEKRYDANYVKTKMAFKITEVKDELGNSVFDEKTARDIHQGHPSLYNLKPRKDHELEGRVVLPPDFKPDGDNLTLRDLWEAGGVLMSPWVKEIYDIISRGNKRFGSTYFKGSVFVEREKAGIMTPAYDAISIPGVRMGPKVLVSLMKYFELGTDPDFELAVSRWVQTIDPNARETYSVDELLTTEAEKSDSKSVQKFTSEEEVRLFFSGIASTFYYSFCQKRYEEMLKRMEDVLKSFSSDVKRMLGSELNVQDFKKENGDIDAVAYEMVKRPYLKFLHGMFTRIRERNGEIPSLAFWDAVMTNTESVIARAYGTNEDALRASLVKFYDSVIEEFGNRTTRYDPGDFRRLEILSGAYDPKKTFTYADNWTFQMLQSILAVVVYKLVEAAGRRARSKKSDLTLAAGRSPKYLRLTHFDEFVSTLSEISGTGSPVLRFLGSSIDLTSSLVATLARTMLWHSLATFVVGNASEKERALCTLMVIAVDASFTHAERMFEADTVDIGLPLLRVYGTHYNAYAHFETRKYLPCNLRGKVGEGTALMMRYVFLRCFDDRWVWGQLRRCERKGVRLIDVSSDSSDAGLDESLYSLFMDTRTQEAGALRALQKFLDGCFSKTRFSDSCLMTRLLMWNGSVSFKKGLTSQSVTEFHKGIGKAIGSALDELYKTVIARELVELLYCQVEWDSLFTLRSGLLLAKKNLGEVDQMKVNQPSFYTKIKLDEGDFFENDGVTENKTKFSAQQRITQLENLLNSITFALEKHGEEANDSVKSGLDDAAQLVERLRVVCACMKNMLSVSSALVEESKKTGRELDDLYLMKLTGVISGKYVKQYKDKEGNLKGQLYESFRDYKMAAEKLDILKFENQTRDNHAVFEELRDVIAKSAFICQHKGFVELRLIYSYLCVLSGRESNNWFIGIESKRNSPFTELMGEWFEVLPSGKDSLVETVKDGVHLNSATRLIDHYLS